ncbi:hypothetical protein [Anaerovibrio lipolyticus]|uniref:hypothetical protein n=1 Tax=Anaerovibrio lipolyticus TaxID=82374 RepID=UPI0004882AC1|nr:hypothetical protein [Anaerovibrio lipolyticus]
MSFNLRIGIFSLIVISLYLAGSNFFGLFEASLLFPGVLSDYIVAGVIIFALYTNKGKIKIHRSDICFWPYGLLLAIACVHMILLYRTGQQSIFLSLATIKDIVYIFTTYLFIQFQFNTEKIIKCIIILDVIGVCVYAMEMANGGPIISSEFHAPNRYETLMGISLWRCWTPGALFKYFTLPYLFIRILKHDTLFGSLLRDKIFFGIIFLGVILKLGRTELFSTLIILILVYWGTNRKSLYGSFRKIFKVIGGLIAISVCLFLFANGIFMRLLEGVVAIFNITDLDSDTTLMVRVSTLLVRYSYLLDQGSLLFGIGPYHWQSTLVVDTIDTYGTNRGVFSPDSGYGTLIIRYGIVGIALYIFGYIKNLIKLKEKNEALYISTAMYIVGVLVGTFSGYNNLEYLYIGLLFSLCIKREKKEII